MAHGARVVPMVAFSRRPSYCNPSWEIRWTHKVNTLNTLVFDRMVNTLEYVAYSYYY